MAAPRVFVSHSHNDNEWCRAFVAALQAAGWDVWYDEKVRHITWQRIAAQAVENSGGHSLGRRLTFIRKA
jgi:hypothetical protein